IATGTLPFKSAEFGHDKDVVRTIEAMFGTEGPGTSADCSLKANTHGGMAIRLNVLSPATLRKALDKALDVYDVRFEPNKVLRYIHKIKDGRNIYLFANITKKTIDTHAKLRGRMQPEIWNPHTGEISKAECTHKVEAGKNVTVVRITLAPFKSVFIVGAR
ncbi:MAG: glycosyl hydrolase, partial [Planctomycetota bacterium]